MQRAILFVVTYAGLNARIATERADAGEERVNKIRELIRSSKYSIHDISRMEPLKSGDLPRFNMPFELGLDIGCRYYGDSSLQSKCCLILDKERYRYQKVLSDISGNDIQAHYGDPEQLIKKIRNWLQTSCGLKLPSGNHLWQLFNEFYTAFVVSCCDAGYDEADMNEMPVSEYVNYVKDWADKNKVKLV